MKIIPIILIYLSFVNPLFSALINKINILGNKRLDNESIRILSEVKVGDNITNLELNEIVKKLKLSGYFKTVNASIIDNKILQINVSEAETIGKVAIEGNEEISTSDLKKEIKLKPLMSYDESVIGEDIKRILLIYKRKGYFRTKVIPKKILEENNKINIVYEITEHSPTYIKNIDFEGNNNFSDRTLKYEILSREYAWWKFLAQFDVYDEDRIMYDSQMLRQFYLRHGFINFKVLSIKGEFSKDTLNYSVKFILEEGDIYKFGKISVINPFIDIKNQELEKAIIIKQDKVYNIDLIEETINKLKTIIAEYGYAFVNIEPILDIKEKIVNIKFDIKKSERVYLNSINIMGNLRTFDNVIEQLLPMRAGDPFSLQTIELGKQKLMRTSYFKDVKIIPSRIDKENLMNLDIRVEEQPTGELSGGIGWSNINGFMIDAGITEKNFMGRGQTVQLKTSWAEYQRQLLFSFTEPYLFNRELSAGIDTSFTSYRFSSLGSLSYDRESILVGGRLGWYLTDNWSQTLRLTANFDFNNDGHLLNSRQDTLYTLGTNFRYYNLNTNFQKNTHSGITANLGASYTGFGGSEHFLKYNFEMNALYNFFEDRWQFRTTIESGYIQALKSNKYVSRVYRYFLGGDSLRGFDIAGVGSRNWFYSNYALGGLWKINGSTQLNFPIFIPDEYSVKGFIFSDYGILGQPPYQDFIHNGNRNYIDSDFRSSIGIGIYWNTPMGPMNFSWGWPLRFNQYDKEKRFLLSFDTRF